jgi:hypothetical protein
MRVTTRPGASGVPRWSSLYVKLDTVHLHRTFGDNVPGLRCLVIMCLMVLERDAGSYLPKAPDIALDVTGNALV